MSLVLLYAAVNVGCGSDAQSAAPDESKEESAAIPVETGVSRTGSIAAYFSGTATLEAEEEADVVAKASGVVQRLLVEEGDLVQAGQVLAELDAERSSLELSQMEANLKRLENDHRRNEELFNKQLISAETYEFAKFQYESQVAAVELARLQIRYSSIRTPIRGVVSARMVKVGAMVAENQAAFRVTDFDPLLAILHVPERELPKLRTGQPTELSVDAMTDRTFKGRVKRISPVVDPSTGTFKVTVEAHDESGVLKPGMLARVDVTYDTRDNVVLVPKQAVVTEDDESTLFVVQDSVAYRRTVVTGYISEEAIEIVSGLEADAVIVTVGQTTLKDSARVTVISR
ncbi:MAG TPA: efflux RND transporter periplasmic adaptor subunit [Rhodothermales bacterium]|nr:efflux RND transporter periplasmic adaptor subunit [Rhodothermales bacterium]